MFTTLRSKIYAGFAAIIAINVLFGLWAIYKFSSVGESVNQAVSANYDLVAQSVQLVEIADDQFRMLQRLPGNTDLFTQFDERTTDFENVLRTVPANISQSGQRAVLQDIQQAYNAFLEQSRRYKALAGQGETQELRNFLYDDLQTSVNTLKRNCFNLFYLNRNEISSIKAQLAEELRKSLLVVSIATIIATLLGIIGGSFYSRWAIRPIQRLTRAVQGLAGGRLGERVLITTADELGDLSFEFNRMTERLRRYEEMNIEQLLLEKRKVETIVQSIATPIVVAGTEMEILLINTAALRLFRLDVTRDYTGLVATDVIEDQGVLRSLRAGLQEKNDTERETDTIPDLYVIEEEGNERFYAVHVLPLETSSAVNGTVAVFSDITHFKELDRLKSDFLAKVSHEFRTPLSSIIMSIDLMREGIVGEINDQQKDLLNSSKEDCKRLSKLISDILELSRLESRLQSSNPALLDLATLVENVLSPHRLVAQEKGITLQADINVPQKLWADAEHVRWLVNNLVSNAIRYTERDGVLQVLARTTEDALIVEVHDTGQGIPLDSLNLIFERFYQVGASGISTPGSIGLGLAIAKDVVESYGGRISVASELNKGAHFTVRIPLARLAEPID